MWVVDSVETKAQELDFSSAGLGRHDTTGLLADGVEIVNALDLLDIPQDFGDPIQVIVCECCGTTGCASGNYIALRRFDNGILMLPAFSAMAQGAWEETEYRPPNFLDKYGAPLFTGRPLALLASLLPAITELSRWPAFTFREAALLQQWEAPQRVLGEFPNPPRLRKDVILACSHGSGLETFAILTELLARALADERPAIPVTGEAVTFCLDLAGYPEWTPLVYTGSDYLLGAAPGVGLSFAGR